MPSIKNNRIAVSIGFWLVVIGLIAALEPAPVQSQRTDAVECQNDELTAADLEALPTIAAGSITDEHLLSFPPPAGKAIDYFTASEIQEFLDESTDCVNAGNIAARYSDYTPGLLSRIDAVDPEILAPVRTGTTIEPPDPPFTCTLIRAWEIDSGHIVAVVQMTPDFTFNTLLLQPDGESWLVDDRWNGLGESLLGDAGTGPFFARPLNAGNDSATPEAFPTRALW